MTKEQERQILKKIDELIKEAGPDSYINTTFAGIVEQAEENITNDWGCNYKQSYETSELQRAETLHQLRKEQETNRDLKEQMKTITGALEAAQAKNTELKQTIADREEREANTIGKLLAVTNQKEMYEAEIINLKAKLYDLMTA